MNRPLNVLMVEDSEDDAEFVLRELRKNGYTPTAERVETADGMRVALESKSWDVVLSDCSMPQFGAFPALNLLKESGVDVPFVIVSGTIGEETAVAAMRAGAHDYVRKDKLARLVPTIERGLREHEERQGRRQAESDLRDSEARYRILFESSPLPMCVLDAATGAFRAVNEAAVSRYGYSHEEFARMTFADLVPARDLATFGRERAQDSALSLDSIRRHRAKDGSIIQVETRSHAFHFDGAPSKLLVVVDVTERMRSEEALRKTEDQLRQAQKMDAIGRLAGGVAHDFNNVLSVILSYSDLILADLVPGDALEADVQEIRGAARRAADLTGQLLLFSRQQVFQPKPLDLNQALAGMDKMLKRLIGADVELVTVLFPGLGRVNADPGHIDQVVMNLAVNARDAMPTGGRLTMETANVTLDEAYAAAHLGVTPGPHVMLAVTDTGTGMDKETQSRIFEPFFTTKAAGKGTGLGLSTVFGIVHQSGGSVWVYSEVGRGTTFKVYLPRVDSEARASRPDQAPKMLRGDETVLLVEDDDQVRAAIRGLLRKGGYEILEARRPDEALQKAEAYSGKIHLLLTDVIMPQMGGPELAKRMAVVRPGIRVLCMSGYTDESVVRHGVVDSGVAYLQKPVTLEALTTKVREVLDAEGRDTPTDPPTAAPTDPPPTAP